MPSDNEHDTLPPSMDPAADGGVIEPPRDLPGIVRRLGPGLIIAASIVGSGELIATTKTGAEAGIALLWLIVIGCLIKVFAQIELGRYAICRGESTLAALDRVPGPRLIANWIVWFWLAMMVCTTGQLGGIVGGVGQALAVTFPIEGDYAAKAGRPSEQAIRRYLAWQDDRAAGGAEFSRLPERERQRLQLAHEVTERKLTAMGSAGQEAMDKVRRGESLSDPYTRDDKYWAAAVALVTAGLLACGRFGLIQGLSTILVVAFTFTTVGNIVALQTRPEWRITPEEFLSGLSFGLPGGENALAALGTALAAFGIIGVGASELITYPYWCLEKGYARFTGRSDGSEAWVERAQGWLRVMRYDAFLSMVVYTLATLAFYLVGVAVLHRLRLVPEDERLVSTLAEMYVPMFGEYARWLFLAGAFAVLYSTFLVASAGNARMLTDGMKIFGLIDRHSETSHRRTVMSWSVAIPILCFLIYAVIPTPVQLVILGGIAQATMLPMLGLGALYLRFRHTDPRLRPGRLWDAMLVLSFLGLLTAGVWGVYTQLTK